MLVTTQIRVILLTDCALQGICFDQPAVVPQMLFRVETSSVIANVCCFVRFSLSQVSQYPPLNLLLSNPLSCLVCVCSPSFLIPLFLHHCRYNEVFLIVDTCQAYSMTLKLYSPNILGVGSSLVGEDSLSVSSSFCTGTLIKFRMTVPSWTGTQDLSFKE